MELIKVKLENESQETESVGEGRVVFVDPADPKESKVEITPNYDAIRKAAFEYSLQKGKGKKSFEDFYSGAIWLFENAVKPMLLEFQKQV